MELTGSVRFSRKAFFYLAVVLAVISIKLFDWVGYHSFH